MNNNTKIRLHLSKNLFESIAKEVLVEAKKPNDGYSVAVKEPKMPKQSKDQAKAPEVQKTDAEATMGEAAPNIPMPSNKPKMPPVPGQASQKPKMPAVPGQKPAGADNAKSTDLAKKAMEFDVIIPTLAKQGIIDDNEKKTLQTLLDKVTQAIANSIKEVETKVAETAPVKETADTAQTLITMLATVLGVGGTIAASVLKDLKNAKTPEEKKQVLQSLAGQITKSKGVDEAKEDKEEE